LQQQHQGHKMTSSSREDTVSPSSSNTDRREHDNDLDDDDCISDLDSEISDPSHLEDIDPVSESRGSTPQPNPLIVNNPFLPPHLQQPAWSSSTFDILRPPPPQLTSVLSGKSTMITSSGPDSPHHSSERQPSPSTPPLTRPLFKPHELAASSPDRNSSASTREHQQRPDHHQARHDRSPKEERSPAAAEFIKRSLPPHPAFPAHHEMLSHFAAVRADFLHREALIRDYSSRERGLPMDFHQHDLRVDFSKAHELARQEFSKQHEHFSAEALTNLARQSSVLGSAS
ncbi:homeobox protein SIX6, partial [Biomphalaria glabrata]